MLGGGHERILAVAARQRERHQASRKRPFNLFTVLRKPSDENHLHSRFLHAVLDHVDPDTGARENLADFTRDVANLPGFDTRGASVERETHRIDLLIAGTREAVVIENKIYAHDQGGQLSRYYEGLQRGRYSGKQVHLLYLTLFGDEPEEHSIGSYRDRLKLISYRDDLCGWLRRCQRRAFDNPSLRESIAQYTELVRELTGTDYNGAYMDEMKDLLRRADNMVLARDITHAAQEALVDLVFEFLQAVGKEADAALGVARDGDYEAESLPKSVRKSVTGKQRHQSGLHYRVTEGIWVSVIVETAVWYGVYCPHDHPKRDRVARSLAGVRSAEQSDHYAWWRVTDPYIDTHDPAPEVLQLLARRKKTKKLARRIADDLAELWKALEQGGIASD